MALDACYKMTYFVDAFHSQHDVYLVVYEVLCAAVVSATLSAGFLVGYCFSELHITNMCD